MKPDIFRKALLKWYSSTSRDLPWKGEKNAYYIWLSEIILQQTRVEQGLPYFERFKKNYPTIKDLADAEEDEVMKLWEGLGYYSRARNLHATAKNIAYNLDGQFPTTYESILKLKGVGPYTAAAIASFAYNLPNAVVDGNVYRVLSRVFGVATPIDSTQGKKEFVVLADSCLDIKKAGIYNQAIMDFGATHCTPKNPNCTACPMSGICVARKENRIGELPVKVKKIKKRNRWFYYLVVQSKGKILVRKREGKDIWQGLYEFPLLELEQRLKNKNEVEGSELLYQLVGNSDYTITKTSKPYSRILSHQKLIIQFWEIEAKDYQKDYEKEGFKAVLREELEQFAFPKTIDLYLSDKSLTLDLF